MNKLQQIERLHQLFSSRRRPLSKATIGQDLGLEGYQIEHLIGQMQTLLGAPIDYCSSTSCYHYQPDANYQLPDCRLTGDEFNQLIRVWQALHNPEDSLLQEELEPLTDGLLGAMRARSINPQHFQRRIRHASVEPVTRLPAQFGQLVLALFDRRQVVVAYRAEGGKEQTLTLCPQQLICRAGRWQLAAWCHRDRQLRCFCAARISHVSVLPARSREIAHKNLDNFFANQLGYSQQQPKTLVLLFSGDNAFEVAQQHWHQDQQGEWQGDQYLLKLPLIDQDQLLARVLANLPNVQVIAPNHFAERLNHILQISLERQTGLVEPGSAARAPVLFTKQA